MAARIGRGRRLLRYDSLRRLTTRHHHRRRGRQRDPRGAADVEPASSGARVCLGSGGAAGALPPGESHPLRQHCRRPLHQLLLLHSRRHDRDAHLHERRALPADARARGWIERASRYWRTGPRRLAGSRVRAGHDLAWRRRSRGPVHRRPDRGARCRRRGIRRTAAARGRHCASCVQRARAAGPARRRRRDLHRGTPPGRCDADRAGVRPGLNGIATVTNRTLPGPKKAVLTGFSAAADTARMRKVWTPPWRWVFGVATGLSLFSFLQAYRLTSINNKPGMAIDAGKLAVLNLALWYVPALLVPAIVWAARRFPFDTGHKLRALIAHVIGALTFAFVHFIGMTSVRFLIWPDGGKYVSASWSQYFQRHILEQLDWTLMVYAVIVGVSHAIAFFHESQERKLKAAQLE